MSVGESGGESGGASGAASSESADSVGKKSGAPFPCSACMSEFHILAM